MRISLKVCLVLTIFGITYGKDLPNAITDNGIGKVALRVYEHCDNSDDIVKCFKIQISKLLGRALKVQNIKLLDGILITKKIDNSNNSRASNSNSDIQINNNDLDKLSAKSLDDVFYNRINKILETHQIQVNIPKLLSYSEQNAESMTVESRKKKEKPNFLGPFIGAALLNAGILKMAYSSIAIVAGKALIVGKIALILSAIIGLKKLVTNEGHEKTTYEIVKHPHVQQSHTYSSSNANEYEGHEGGGSYRRRSLLDGNENIMQDMAYRAHHPKI